MKLQFKVQDYQTEAVDAVVDVFAGQPKDDGITYRIDPGRRDQETLPDDADMGHRNAEIAVTGAQLLDNVHAVQRARHLPLSKALVPSKAAPGAPNLDVEMETGTGKTYVYIKTIMELNRQYGWSKFIIVVPSIAIREGVQKSFEITADHFVERYGTRPRSFVYNSRQLHELEQFSSDAGIRVMIINIQAFNATGKDNRRIYEQQEDFGWRRPIDVIAANRPIVIIDEPQKIGAEKSLASLARFNALMVLRYSATHKTQQVKVHRLDAVDAYREKLVKKIAVRGITVRGLAGSSAYLYVEAIELRKGALPWARVELQVRSAGGAVSRRTMRLEKGSNLHELSGGLEAYRGLFVEDVDAHRDVVHLSDGSELAVGQVTADVSEDSKRRIQIREVIRAHLDKEQELYRRGIKVLSLLFIDEVAKYRDYSREDTLGEYARVFEEEYETIRGEVLAELPFDGPYREYLARDEVRRVHEGYFSIDKMSKRQVDGAVSGRGEDKGQSTDTDAYDLILRNKERLLSLDEPVRFIFSHSALREGWDNPNVFVMGMLKKSDSTISRRQEIGRGLRLAVDQAGERMDNPATVHDINELTVVTDESYTDFVAGLQKEIAESLSARPRQATAAFFTGKLLDIPETGETREITSDEAKQLVHYLVKNDFVDYDNHLTEKWTDRDLDTEIPELPAGLQPLFYQVAGLIDSLNSQLPLPVNGRKPQRLEPNANFERREFQELWRRINHKAVYQVDFDSDELVAKAVQAIDEKLAVSSTRYEIKVGEQRTDADAEELAAGEAFRVTETRTEVERVTASSQVAYDLIGDIAERTRLTRRTAAAILRRIRPGTFGKFRLSPEQFLTEASRLINEEKATAVIEHLSYDPLQDSFDTVIFTDNQVKQDLSRVGDKLTKHIYDYAITDSTVERDFAVELDTSDEVAVYAKLPRGFAIPTPVGDYNPDWAIAFEEGSVRHVYFVAETKGTMSSMQLRTVEQAKIDCARKFFEALNEKNRSDVRYEVVKDYRTLMDLVTGS